MKSISLITLFAIMTAISFAQDHETPSTGSNTRTVSDQKPNIRCENGVCYFEPGNDNGNGKADDGPLPIPTNLLTTSQALTSGVVTAPRKAIFIDTQGMSEEDIDSRFKNTSEEILVVKYGSPSCPPCNRFDSEIPNILGALGSDKALMKINVQQRVGKYRISGGIPAIAVYVKKNGKWSGEVINPRGFPGVKELKSRIDEAVKRIKQK